MHWSSIPKDRPAVWRPGHLVVTWHSLDSFHPKPGTELSVVHIVDKFLERLTKGALLLSRQRVVVA